MAVLLLVFLLKLLHCSHFLGAGAVQYGICILVLAFSHLILFFPCWFMNGCIIWVWLRWIMCSYEFAMMPL